MAIHGLTGEDRFEATSRAVLDRFGVSLTIGSDFEEYRELLAEGQIGRASCRERV